MPRDKLENKGTSLAVIVVDERGRLTIPSEYQVRKTRATIIPSGSFLIVVPLPSAPLEVSGGWLQSRLERRTLKDSADKAARKDAARRAKRRKQL
jgi:bifunctional DNA-binding transcriptional regulator/antitoxin component of YhaV-PrlF toxin-antitoxin module